MKTNKSKFLSAMAMIAMIAAIYSCKYDDFVITDTPFVEFTNVELFIGENAGSRSMIQVNISPDFHSYELKSLEPEVATVTQSGLIKAVGEGFATITVTSKDDLAYIYVFVRQWIPVDDINLNTTNITRTWNGYKEMLKIDYTLIPENHTQNETTWWSSDPSVVSVREHGWLTFNNQGQATVFVGLPSGEIKAIEVEILPPVVEE